MTVGDDETDGARRLLRGEEPLLIDEWSAVGTMIGRGETLAPALILQIIGRINRTDDRLSSNYLLELDTARKLRDYLNEWVPILEDPEQMMKRLRGLD